MSDFGFEEGISNQNAMTSQAIRANAMSQDIRKRTIDQLQRNFSSTKEKWWSCEWFKRFIYSW